MTLLPAFLFLSLIIIMDAYTDNREKYVIEFPNKFLAQFDPPLSLKKTICSDAFQ